MKKKFYSCLFFGLTFLLSCQSSLACGCGYIENPSSKQVSENYEKAVAVFSGEVIESEFEKVKFKINSIWKGEIGDELIMSTGGKKTREGWFQYSTCDYNFDKSQSYLVFAFGKNFENMKASVCSLTRELKSAEKTQRLLDELFERKKKVQISENNFLNSFNFTI